ncbi:hypothetical protein AMTR_s00022p00113930 [Amborella trichopoda]|uniref:Uncharacterized protein n=1 Tax=Amborella trichopoda TaxID=13333 RepID=W1PUJ0_AMBTC|nr:hypothetical protein AMTR_s00022p00113930 [Amborella trichopoda]
MELTESDINELEQSMADPCAAGQCPDEVERPKLPSSATMLPRLEEEAGRMQMLPPSSASATATATGIEWQSPQVQLPQSTIMPVGQSSQMNTIQLAPLPHSTLMCPQYEVTPGWMQMPGGHSNRMCPHYEQTAGWMHSSQVNTPQLPPLPHSTLMLPLPLPLPHYQENARQSSQLNTPQLPPLPHSTLTFPFPMPMPLPHYQENAAPTQMPIPTAPPQLPHYNGASFNYGDFW